MIRALDGAILYPSQVSTIELPVVLHKASTFLHDLKRAR